MVRILLLLFLINCCIHSAAKAKFPYLVYYGSDLKLEEFSRFETVVIDPKHYPDVKKVQSRTLGYISVGEIENFRSHYKEAERLGLLGEINPNWPDSRFVSLQGKVWEKMVLEKLVPKILSGGYKGLFLDTVDSLLFSGQSQESILEFLTALRKRFPEIHIQMNRGLEIAARAPVDSLLLESTIADHNFKTKGYELIQNGPTFDFPAKIELFSLDYWDPSDPAGQRYIYDEAVKKGYQPLVSDLSLQSLPILLRDKSGEYILSNGWRPLPSTLQRRIVALYDSRAGETSFANQVHDYLEVILNYYGYFCDYYDMANPPTILDGSPILFWIKKGDDFEKPIVFLKWLYEQKLKGSRILWFGSVPGMAPWTDKKSSEKISSFVEEKFQFQPAVYHSDSKLGIKVKTGQELLGFEAPMNIFSIGIFKEFVPLHDGMVTLLGLQNSSGTDSSAVFQAPWGLFAQGDMILLDRYDKQRWLVNPYVLVQKSLLTHYPIPETTTIRGKRIFYAHIDGDGALSKSTYCKGKLNLECMLTFLNEFPVRTGISLIGGEMDRKLKGNDRARRAARELMAHPLVEPATHTYSHPFDWESGVVAMTLDPGAKVAPWGESGSAYKLPAGKVDMRLEATGSIDLISKLIPKSKKVKSLYWSGSCNPTEKQLAYLNKHKIPNLNGGDSFFDVKHPSLAYLFPLTRMVGRQRQIYSSNANENVYTYLWTRQFWGFSKVLETFEKTGKPLRIKPINVYYHFYSLEKHPSYRALQKIYRTLQQWRKDLVNVYPSEFIRIAQGFFEVQIERKGLHKFQITGAENLKDFRFPGDVRVRGQNIEATFYDPGQDVTYIRIGPKSSALFEISGPGSS